MNAALAFLHGLKPQDELAGLLAARLFSIHTLSMEMMARAATSENPSKWTDAAEKYVIRYTNQSICLPSGTALILILVQTVCGFTDKQPENEMGPDRRDSHKP